MMRAPKLPINHPASPPITAMRLCFICTKRALEVPIDPNRYKFASVEIYPSRAELPFANADPIFGRGHTAREMHPAARKESLQR